MRYHVMYRSPQIEEPKVEIQAKPEIRTYASGEPIPESLPNSYGMAQNCYNCFAYDLTTEMCSTYNATVRPNYWCATWEKII